MTQEPHDTAPQRQPFSIRPANSGDLQAVVDVHCHAFPGSFLTSLGPGFLSRYYKLVLGFPTSIFLVAEANSRVVGFLAGFIASERFYQTLARNKWRFVLPILFRLMTHPRLLVPVLFSSRRVLGGRAAPIADPMASEIASLGVLPPMARHGIGRALMDAGREAAKRGGATMIWVITDAVGHDWLNAFYQRLGYQIVETYQRPGGRWMNHLVMRLGPSCRDEQTVRAA